MKRSKTSIFLTVLLVLSAFSILFPSMPVVQSAPLMTFVKSANDEEGTFGNPNLQNMGVDAAFYAENRTWLFYGWEEGYYTSSSDDVTWAAGTSIGDIYNQLGISADFNGTHVAYVRVEDGDDVYFRLGSPNSTGVIDWVTSEQKVLEAGAIDVSYPNIKFDADGYVWISHTNQTNYCVVRKNAWLNGSWQDDTGFPVQLGGTSSNGWSNVFVPLDNGEMMCLYARNYLEPLHWQTYDGAWSGEANVTGSIETNSHDYDGVNVGNDVYASFTDRDAGVGNYETLITNKWFYANSSWGTPLVIDDSTNGNIADNALVRNSTSDDIALLYRYTRTGGGGDRRYDIYRAIYDDAGGTWGSSAPAFTLPYLSMYVYIVTYYQSYTNMYGLDHYAVFGVAGVAAFGTGDFDIYVGYQYQDAWMEVALNTPLDDAVIYDENRTIDFVFTPTWYVVDSVQNASLHVSNDWSSYNWNTTSISNATQNTIAVNLTGVYGAFYWNVQLFNSTTSVWASANYDLILFECNLEVELNTPISLTTVYDKTINFVFTPTWTGLSDAHNASLHVTDSWATPHWNTTSLSNATLNTIQYTVLDYGVYTWNVQLFNSTTSVWASSNYVITVEESTSPTIPPIVDPTTYPADWYFRSDTHTIHDTLAYRLSIVQSNTLVEDSRVDAGAASVSYGVRIYTLDYDGTVHEVTGGSPEAIVTRAVDGEGLQSVAWTCPPYPYVIDSVKVMVYQRFDSDAWSLRRIYMTKAEMLIRFPEAEWTFYYYSNRTTASTTAYFKFGDLSHLSRIAMYYQDVSPWEKMMYWVFKGDLLAFFVVPWTHTIGEMFYGLVVLFMAVTTYNRYQSIRSVMVIAWLFGGVGSFLPAMLPVAGLGLANLVLALAVAITLYKLFR